MKPDYQQREADPSTAEEGDDGVLAVYLIDITAMMLLDIVDALADGEE